MRGTLLPRQADNSYGFHKAILFIFGAMTLLTIGRSLAHMFLPDGGANAIATIITFDGNPDPDAVIYNIFALWGLAQLAMGAMYVIVIIRYRNLIPLMWVFILVEYAMRIVIGKLLKPMGDAYFIGTAPGEISNYIFIPLAAIMILWSLAGRRNRNQE
jgi:hypothetical protein